MKFSKSSWIILVLVAMVIGVISIAGARTQQIQQQQSLEKSLVAAQKKLTLIKLDELTAQKDQLIDNQTLYTAQIAAARSKLTAPIDNIAATDIILKSAHDFNLRIVNISSGGISDNTMAGNKFTKLPFSLQVEGSLNNIAGFVSNVKILFPTSMVETYQFDIGAIKTASPAEEELSPSGEALTAESPPVVREITLPNVATPTSPTETRAGITITIYDYKGN
jgi:hypothetical protein